jgi:hypothetical protein
MRGAVVVLLGVLACSPPVARVSCESDRNCPGSQRCDVDCRCSEAMDLRGACGGGQDAGSADASWPDAGTVTWEPLPLPDASVPVVAIAGNDTSVWAILFEDIVRLSPDGGAPRTATTLRRAQDLFVTPTGSVHVVSAQGRSLFCLRNCEQPANYVPSELDGGVFVSLCGQGEQVLALARWPAGSPDRVLDFTPSLGWRPRDGVPEAPTFGRMVDCTLFPSGERWVFRLGGVTRLSGTGALLGSERIEARAPETSGWLAAALSTSSDRVALVGGDTSY